MREAGRGDWPDDGPRRAPRADVALVGDHHRRPGPMPRDPAGRDHRIASYVTQLIPRSSTLTAESSFTTTYVLSSRSRSFFARIAVTIRRSSFFGSSTLELEADPGNGVEIHDLGEIEAGRILQALEHAVLDVLANATLVQAKSAAAVPTSARLARSSQERMRQSLYLMPVACSNSYTPPRCQMRCGSSWTSSIQPLPVALLKST